MATPAEKEQFLKAQVNSGKTKEEAEAAWVSTQKSAAPHQGDLAPDAGTKEREDRAKTAATTPGSAQTPNQPSGRGGQGQNPPTGGKK